MIKKFDRSNMEPGLPGIVILSHGPLAASILESAAVITGSEVKNSAAFCLEAEDDPMEYGETVSEALKEFPDGCLIFTDIIGGTPYNQLMIHSRKNKTVPLAVTGVSLPMVIVAATLRQSGLSEDELLKAVISESIEGMINVKERFKAMSE